MDAKELRFHRAIQLAILFSILIALLYQSSLNYQCMSYHADGAVWTISGVMCYRSKTPEIREYYDLDDLREKHDGPPKNMIIPPKPSNPEL